ncbi:MAG: four helix bundle protein [Patescibacteria group bacterium]|jgi:four helix bundle protein
MLFKSYQDLIVWQKAIDLVKTVYELTASFPQAELFGLTTQIRRAAVSVPSNIAEGYGRRSDGDFARFILISRGSLMELETQLLIAKSLGFGKPEQFRKTEGLLIETSKLTYAFVAKLRSFKK